LVEKPEEKRLLGRDENIQMEIKVNSRAWP
jgi:hypothetical protein